MRLTPLNVLVTTLLLALSVSVVYLKPWFVATMFSDTFRFQTGRDALSNVSFHVPKDKWLTFSVPPYQPALKVVVNAVIEPGTEVPIYDPLLYSLNYELVGESGDIIKSGNYHFEAGLTKYYDAARKEIHNGWFYNDSHAVPADPSVAIFDLESIDRPVKFLRISKAENDNRMQQLSARVYVRQRTSERSATSDWKRMSGRERNLLMRANVFGSQLASERETINVMLNRWSPLAPNGVAGIDYTQELIHRLYEPEGRLPAEEIMPEGVLITPQLAATVPLPREGGKIELVFARNLTALQSAKPAKVNIRWYGRGFEEREEFSVVLDGNRATFNKELGGGVLELQSEATISAQAWLSANDRKVDVTPERRFLRAYSLSPSLPIDFDVLHVKNELAQFRIDIRHKIPIQQQEAGTLQVSLIGDDGAIVDSHKLSVSTVPNSRFDQFLSKQEALPISDVTRHYLRIDKSVSRLQLTASTPDLFVNVYNRTPLVLRETRVPHDYYHYNRDDKLKRDWHALSANNHSSLLQSGSSALIEVRNRPPEDDPLVLAGSYKFEQYQPQGRWRGRSLLTAYSGDGHQRSELLPSLYHEVPTGKNLELSLRGQPWEKLVQPELLYISEKQKTFQLDISRNNQQILKRRLSATRGELQLPDLPKTAATFRFETDTPSTKLYMNSINKVSDKALLKQFAQKLNKNTLEYPYKKTSVDNEVLSARFYHQGGSNESTELLVTIEGISKAIGWPPITGYTYQAQSFVIDPISEPDVIVLDSGEDNLRRGELFFISLGADLVPGDYRIVVRHKSGPAGYLRLSRVIAGEYEEHRAIRRRKVSEE